MHDTMRFGLAALALAAAGCGGSGRPEDRPADREPVTVSAVAAATVETADRLEAGGVVAAGVSATISSRVVAPVAAVRVRAGDRVRAGQVLVLLDDRAVPAQARQAGAAVAAAEQALTAARADLDAATAEGTLAAAWHARIARLHAQRSATTQELDEAEARRAAARARVEAARARAEQASASVAAMRAAAEAAAAVESFTTIVAPFDGLVTERLVDPGTLAAPGTPLLRLDASGPSQVEVRVDEARMPFLRVGDRVEVELGGGRDGRPSLVDGTVAELARAVDADRRTFTVTVALPRTVELRSGTFARVRFRGASRAALVVPSSAIRRQGQVATLFVVDGGAARLRLVQANDLPGGTASIAAGLAEGEIVVIDPPPGLTDGRRVRPTLAPPAAEAR